ncbi:crossover junction endodeoxyribonuclease RuvC [Desulfolucanica intricata]|uniref:crossover junction endodeoxyribonuclease RuvC n=1 Tax=Desulfolucanica intricata TaxID=1285191 RepID=UPI00082BA9CC|nr:crossover junction endodeoxyribonuclease RuvC [Desulfolucanica intricata]
MIIMGVDPGTAITGFGLINYQGNRFSAIEYNCIKTPPKIPLAERLLILYREMEKVINKYRPDRFAVEKLFFNKNTRTALAVGHARGVVFLLGARAGLKIYEYTPLEVKQAVVGYGRADKQQVQYMVKTILGLSAVPKPDDVADALAVAICHAHFGTGIGGLL